MTIPSLSREVLAELARRFRIVREVGHGGMGTVLLGHDTSLDRDVALKILSPEGSSALGDDRFTREIRVTARLVHPNIVPLYDSGSAAGCLYYVMPHLDGPTLRQRMDREGPRPAAEVVRIIADLYSLDCVAFELSTGRPPSETRNPMALLAAHLTAPVPSASTFRPETPGALASLLIQLMAKAPEDRPATEVIEPIERPSLGCQAIRTHSRW